MSESIYQQAADSLRNATAIIITAGAGMGVDSGLPDFRGDQGFWTAYPMYQRLNLSFVQAANPEHFERDPLFGWGFYGHRTNLYRSTIPHQGFTLLTNWIERLALDYFVVTSNVDGQFQKAGFAEERILEVHGSIHHLQCTAPCSYNIWPNNAEITINETTMRATTAPQCPHCRRVARPNILMFGDYSWLHQRTAAQETHFENFIAKNQAERLVVVEMGAGSAIPTIRNLSERLGRRQHVRVLRINPREPQIGTPHLSFGDGAVATLNKIEAALQQND
ncbi:MAG TPA: Sir2 family NAD-dependent protein deacetylase [Malonomonas sp.]